MNLAPKILAALRGASEPLSNIGIREQIAELGDVPAIDAQHLVANAINELVRADQIERIWSEGRYRYVIASNAPAVEDLDADPRIEVSATHHSGDPLPAPAPAAPVPPPLTKQAAIAMPKASIPERILAALSHARIPMKISDICKRMPDVEGTAVAYQARQLLKTGQIVATGATSARLYAMPGVTMPATPATEQRKVAKPPKAAKQAKKSKPHKTADRKVEQPAAPSLDPSRVDLIAADRLLARRNAVLQANADAFFADQPAPISVADLRAAASDILLAHGADPLPRALHRLVIAALGAPESLAA